MWISGCVCRLPSGALSHRSHDGIGKRRQIWAFVTLTDMPFHTDSRTGDFDVVEVKTQYENVWWW